ncbi:hypothetical protein TNIN_160351 [Trichonephila inaurata madagascariensis]|uniref:Uncharacterized protein n=1 Tax=Trichonephila inaurata madagascariensis TaxID=2747483 RepID=A0A8X7CB09_9ARAC|nr:hypothetical protein TNIN_160351 [Trichonephila inaurata madagascariensis]
MLPDLGKILKEDALMPLCQVGYCIHRQRFEGDILDLVLSRDLADVQLGNDFADFLRGGERKVGCGVAVQKIPNYPVHLVYVIVLIRGSIFGD